MCRLHLLGVFLYKLITKTFDCFGTFYLNLFSICNCNLFFRISISGGRGYSKSQQMVLPNQAMSKGVNQSKTVPSFFIPSIPAQNLQVCEMFNNPGNCEIKRNIRDYCWP